ncbi:MAG: hypothetical protein LHV68_12990 [Elusimicrobia bacterium]|nr:hypothetical protein [Candidatus Liberimonas magnetica]
MKGLFMKNPRNLKSIIGIFTDTKDVARKHDEYLSARRPRKGWARKLRLMKKRADDIIIQ